MALGAVEHSTFGGLLERAEQFGFDSEGHAVPAKKRGTWYTPVRAERSEPAANHDDRVLRLIGEVSRRLMRVSRTAHAVLNAYFGDQGTRFAIAAIYPLTPTGRDLLARAAWTTLDDAYAVVARATVKEVGRMRTEAVVMLAAAKKEHDRAL